ncbi:hypothetical protein PYW07_014474 [Mythimna separata]|uniref:Uncharacterized protein n=1 Tax=Mythimna separata TaxID=271217 RepID=A0AAD7Z006_MYTSE|nr:hypothetical protein PYW07_014474 [Mythimna separata]
MYRNVLVFIVLWGTVACGNYQRYNEPGDARYATPSTWSSSYTTAGSSYSQNQYPYKSATYGSDISNFPEVTRYPNYSPGLSTSKYNSYTTQRTNQFYPPGGDITPRYGDTYKQGYGQNYGQGYGQSFGQGYGQDSLGYGTGYSSYEMPFMKNIRDYCVNRSPQQGIWVDSLMGMWYGVEFVQHLAGDSRIDYARTCIVIHISEPVDQPSTENQLFHVQHINAKFRQEYRHLRLLWDEAGQTIEYSLYFKNDSAGYWQVFDGQNGTLTTLPRYQQFSGTIQVLKAVNDHLLLNFCQDQVNGKSPQLYSVLFSREPGFMERWELDSVHALLQNKKLSVASRRMVCGVFGKATTPKPDNGTKVPCEGVHVHGKLHRRHIIMNGLNRPYQLAIYNHGHKIFFSYNMGEDTQDTFGIAYVKINDTMPTDINGIKNGFAVAVDEHNKTAYFGGSDGIYVDHLEKSHGVEHVVKGRDIWDLQLFNHHLYFIQYPSQRLHIYDRKEKVVTLQEHIQEKIYQFAIDGDGDTFITTRDGLFEVKKGENHRIPYSGPKVFRAIEVNHKGVAHFCAQSAVYVAHKENRTLVEIASIKNIFGITFDSSDHIIYSNPHEIVKLVPHECK